MISFTSALRFMVGGLLFVAFAQPSFAGIDVVSQWVLPGTHPFREVGPTETTAPVVVGDIIYSARSDGTVSAVHRIHSNTLWQKRLPSNGGVEGSLAYGRSKLFVGDNKGYLYALNARDGSIAWQFKSSNEWLSPAVVARDRIFIVSSNDEIFSFSEIDGQEKWRYAQRGDEKMTVRGSSTPTVFGSEVYAGFSDGSLVAFSAASGRLLWRQKLKSRDRFYDVDMAPFVDEKSVVAATFDGSLYHLNRLNGETKWILRVGSYGGFLVEDNRIYFSGLNGNFLAVNRDDGSVIWKTAYEGGVGQTPVRVGEHLVITTSGDPMYMINPKDGKIVWQGRLGTGALSPVATHPDGWFYTLSNFGNLYSFGILNLPTAPPADKEQIKTPSAISRFG